MAAIATPSFVRSRSRILVASADPALRKRVLQDPLYADSDSEEAVGGAHALAKLLQSSCDSVLLDRNLPDLDAQEVAEQIRKQFPRVEVEMLDARFVGSKQQESEFRKELESVDEETEQAAAPFVAPKVSEASTGSLPKASAIPTAGRLFDSLPGMIGSSPAMQEVYELVRMVAHRDTAVLVNGETGTGKELVAGAIHQLSKRSRHAFVIVNCAAIPESSATAQAPILQIPGISVRGDSTSITIIFLLTLLTLLPAILLSMTPFVRILIVFHFLRQALGTQTAPTNQTLIGLALFLTYFVMQPVGAAVHAQAVAPFQAGHLSSLQALERGSVPLRQFMLEYTREKDLALFLEMSKEPRPKTPQDLSMRVVIPAYIISELKTGFQIGAVLFLPFLVIDLVTASITTSIGMLQLPPVVISTPLKILLFVVADGWHMVVGSMLKSFHY